MLNQWPRVALTALLAINIVGYIDRALLMAFAPQIAHDLTLTNTQFGFLSGAAWVFSYSVMVVVCGALADRHSRTRVISIGVLIWSACTAASGLAQDFGQMAAARLLVASGEAALVPAATNILADLFDERRRAVANGLFFIGMPLGIGLAYTLSGTIGSHWGWRNTYFVLGGIGVVVSFFMWFVRDAQRTGVIVEDGAPGLTAAYGVLGQIRQAFAGLRQQPTLWFVIGGLVLVHLAIVTATFTPLWLTRELGMDSSHAARLIGALQIGGGCFGAVFGGWAADRFARWRAGGAALFTSLSVLICVPLMLLSRVSGADSLWLPLGLAATSFLPFSLYGGSMALIQMLAPAGTRSTVVGFAMLSLNIIAIALGSIAAGLIGDHLVAAGNPHPLQTTLVWVDLLTFLAAPCCLIAARRLYRANTGAAAQPT